MGMWASSDFFKRSLNYLTSAVTRVAVNTSQPASATDAWGIYVSTAAGSALARSSSASVGAPGSTTNGWTVKVSSQSALTVSTSGNATHISLLTGTTTGLNLLYVTTCNTRALTTSETVTLPSWNIRIPDPTSS